MKVNFDNTEQNWRLWGELVELWIYNLHPKPTDTVQLVNQMTAHGIKNPSVPGDPNRKVMFYSYTDADPLVMLLPTEDMLKAARKTVLAGEVYPLPVFYDDAYSGARKILSEDEDTLLAACRVGEYTINNCC
ncbi:MAG TPA: hypothetical protein VHX39_05810 [Acetobacteraceae bacterium]|jgi:hypothetical protein|nr:hypothetical protein [Acetobacteraceae bacterium]